MDPDSTWEAASNMKKYDDKYELVLAFVDGKTGARRESTVIKSVGDYIDENGVICLDILEVNVNKCLCFHELPTTSSEFEQAGCCHNTQLCL